MFKDRFERQTFESTTFLLPTSEKKKIQPGGSSNSSIFNRYIDAMTQDVMLLATRLNILANKVDRIDNASAAQSAALLSALQSVTSRVDAASGYSQVLADIHSSTYIDTGTTTASLNYQWGQATLPVQSQTDLLIQRDAYGNPDVYTAVEVSYATGSEPNNLSYAVDIEALEMLKGTQNWILPETSSDLWIKIKAPLQFRGLTPNVLEVYPIPAFGLDLVSVSFQKAGDSFSSSWVDLDLSYLPNYVVSSSKVEMVGPFRLHLTNDPISQIRLHFTPRSTVSWGFAKEGIKIYHVEYDSSATLVVKDPYSRTIGNSTIRGKDPSDLSLLSKSTNSNKVTINLTTSNSTSSPVITAVVMAV